MKRKFIRGQTAEGYIDVAIAMLILFTLMASLMALFPIFTAQQSLNQTAKYMARTVELYGKADDETLQSVMENGDFIAPDAIKIKTQWYDAAEKTIQLKTQFTITVTKTVPIVILRPALGEPLTMGICIYLGLAGILMSFSLMLPMLIACMVHSLRKHGTLRRAIPFAPVLAFGAGTAVIAGYLYPFILL